MKPPRVRTLLLSLVALYSPGCGASNGPPPPDAPRKVAVAAVRSEQVVITQSYVCRLEPRRYAEVRIPEKGQVVAITVKEGQAVKQGDLICELAPPGNVPNQDKRTAIKAPFDGLIGRLPLQKGNLVQDQEMLTTLSDNSVMFAMFKVPEKQYLDFMADGEKFDQNADIELVLADHKSFPQHGKLGEISTETTPDKTDIVLRADFPNPTGLLRRGQSGTLLIHWKLGAAVVIPQLAAFDRLERRYVWVVGKDQVAHERAIEVQHEVGDSFVIKKGVGVGEMIVLEGVRQVRDGDKIEGVYDPQADPTRRAKSGPQE